MITPYKLVYISFILFLSYIFVLFLLRRKAHYHFYSVILASLLPLVSLLRKGVHESGDFAINIAKTIDLTYSLSYGIFPVHWASLLNATYGYPLFLFTYPLPYYSIAALKFVGFSFVDSEKIVIAAVFVLSGIGMYLLTKHFLQPASAALASILYLFAPYHLVDMHFRVALGELFAFAALPFVFYGIVKTANARKVFFPLFFTSTSFACLILSHQAIALVSAPFVFLLPLIVKTSFKQKALLYFSLTLGFLITAFYWLPLLYSIQFTHQVDYAKTVGFENPLLYLISPWRFTLLYQGPTGQLAFPIGYVQLALILFSVILLARNKIRKKYRKLLTGLVLILTFLTILLLPISEPLWKVLPFMTNFQFAYRLMLPISFIAALIGGIVIEHLKSTRILKILFFSTIFLTILNWGTRTVIPDINDGYLIKRTPYTTYEGEGLQPASPKWRDPNNIWIKEPPDAPIQLLKGKALVQQLERTPILHSYNIEVFEASSFVENTFYFPGWNLYANGKKHEFSFIDSTRSNLIYFSLPPGDVKIDLKFEPTPVVIVANYTSIVALIILLSGGAYFFFHNRR